LNPTGSGWADWWPSRPDSFLWARSNPGSHDCWPNPATMQLSAHCMKNHAMITSSLGGGGRGDSTLLWGGGGGDSTLLWGGGGDSTLLGWRQMVVIIIPVVAGKIKTWLVALLAAEAR